MKDFPSKSVSWNPRFLTLVAMTMAAAMSRLIPHPPNLTPIDAIALFGGAYFTSKRAAFAVPLGAMLISNVAIAFMRYGTSVFPRYPFVYLSFAITVCIGLFIRGRRSLWTVGTAALLSALIFFFLSNLGVWLKGTMYPLTFDGFIACYVAAIPFFRNTVLGNLIYVGVLFGSFELASCYIPALRERPVSVLTDNSSF